MKATTENGMKNQHINQGHILEGQNGAGGSYSV